MGSQPGQNADERLTTKTTSEKGPAPQRGKDGGEKPQQGTTAKDVASKQTRTKTMTEKTTTTMNTESNENEGGNFSDRQLLGERPNPSSIPPQMII